MPQRSSTFFAAVVSLAMLCSLAAAGAQFGPAKGDPARSAATPSEKLPAWDVVSVHPADPNLCGKRSGIQFTQDGIKGFCVALLFVIEDAYGIMEPSRIIGAPDWVKTGMLWDFDAKVAGEDVAAYQKLSEEDNRHLRQTMLTDRFHMKAHIEKREMPVYDLVVAKGGPKLKEATADENGKSHVMMHGAGKIDAVNATLDSLPWILNSEAGRPVVDKTGLAGNYDYTLEYVPAARAAADETGGPSIFTALEEQLGLKLEPAKEMMDVLVIDSIEQPAAN